MIENIINIAKIGIEDLEYQANQLGKYDNNTDMLVLADSKREIADAIRQLINLAEQYDRL